MFLHGQVVSCLLDSFIRRVSVFLSVPSWPPADTANVLRGISAPSPHRMEQTGRENVPGVYSHVAERRNSFYDLLHFSASVLIYL